MTPRSDLMALPVSKKLELIEQLWDSLSPAEKDHLSVPDWHRAELERRQEEIDANPGDDVPWDEVKRQQMPD